jgi:hypothetical protein
MCTAKYPTRRLSDVLGFADATPVLAHWRQCAPTRSDGGHIEGEGSRLGAACEAR